MDNGRNKVRTQNIAASDSHFSSGGIGQKLDVLHSLAKVIEHSRSAIEQDPTIFSHLDALGTAVEQAHANSPFKFRDRPGNGGLSRIEERGRLAHVAGLHYGHEDMKVVQLHPDTDAVAQLHFGTIAGLIYRYQNIALFGERSASYFLRQHSRKLAS
jgi:hypothetical protein